MSDSPAAVKDAQRILAYHDVRLVPANLAGDVTTDVQGRLQVAVRVPQKCHVFEAQHLARVDLLLAAYR